jgi:cell division protein FtsA
MAREYKDVVVGLDIGTAKVMAVVAEVLPNGELKLAGLGVAPSNGLKRGVVVNIDATVQSIQQALKEAELMADCKIQRVYTGITGSHIRGLNSSGMVAVKDKEVTAADVARVVETAKAINISSDQRLLLVEPQEFVIDGQDVKEPIGMSGIRLEAKIHIVTGAQSAAENIIKCVRRCGLEVEQLMLNPLASSQAVLTDDERELGVVLVDIGAGTTDVAIFTGGAIRHTAVIPIAGDLITSDIAMALRTPTKDAEDIKVESGYAKQLLADPEAQVEVPGLGDRSPRMLSKQALAGVIEPRVEEIFSLVQQVVRESGYEEVLSSGIVLTGGSSVMPGMIELGEDIFLKPVRRGIPKYSSALSDMVAQPRAATVMGLLEEARLARLRGLQGGAKERVDEDRVRPLQGFHRGELLTMKYPGMSAAGPPQGAKAPLRGSAARGSPHRIPRGRWRCIGPPYVPRNRPPFPIWQLNTYLETGAPHDHRNDRSRRIQPGHPDQGDRRGRRRQQCRRAHDCPQRAGRGVCQRQHRRAGADPQLRPPHHPAGPKRPGRRQQARQGPRSRRSRRGRHPRRHLGRAHAVHHRRHGRRHGHRRGARDCACGQGNGHSHRGRGHQALRLGRWPPHEAMPTTAWPSWKPTSIR